jgi:putative DNA primase/helicase
MSEQSLVNLEEIRAQVEARRQDEADKLAPQTAPGSKHGGPDDPRFVLECLDNNERGDGILYATLHRGRFVYVKSRDEKSKAWFRFNGVHWEVDKGDFHHAAVEDVALVYQREAERIPPEIAEAREQLIAANKMVEHFNSVSKELKKDGAPESIAACNSEGRQAEEAALHAKIALAKLVRLQKALTDRIKRLRSLSGAKSCIEWSHKIGKEGLFIYGDEVDKKPDLLPAKNGVIDLQTGELLPGRPDDYLVRALPIAYVPGAKRPTWDPFMAQIHEDDAEKIAFIKRWWGYCLTGHVTEQMYVMFTGDGANGKGTMLEVAQEIFGELAKQVMAEMLVKTKNIRSSTGASPDILALQGRRWVFVDETSDGDAVNAAEIKRTTGGNRRSGRGLFDKFDTEFQPTHKLSIITNHPLRGIAATYSLERRLVYIKYRLRFDPDPEAAAKRDPGNAQFYRLIDKNLELKLRSEREGILAYMVEGAMEWYQSGLAVPQCLLEAREEIKANEDTLGQFLHATARLGDDYEMPAKDFLTSYLKWYIEEGHPEKWKPTRNNTYNQLRSKGFTIPDNRTTGGTTTIYGLDLNKGCF